MLEIMACLEGLAGQLLGEQAWLAQLLQQAVRAHAQHVADLLSAAIEKPSLPRKVGTLLLYQPCHEFDWLFTITLQFVAASASTMQLRSFAYDDLEFVVKDVGGEIDCSVLLRSSKIVLHFIAAEAASMQCACSVLLDDSEITGQREMI